MARKKTSIGKGRSIFISGIRTISHKIYQILEYAWWQYNPQADINNAATDEDIYQVPPECGSTIDVIKNVL